MKRKKKKSIPLSLEVANFSVFKLIQLIMGFVFGFVVAYLCGVAKENKKKNNLTRAQIYLGKYMKREERESMQENEKEKERENARNNERERKRMKEREREIFCNRHTTTLHAQTKQQQQQQKNQNHGGYIKRIH